MASAADVRDAVTFAGRALAAATGGIRDIHLAVARRAFTISGTISGPTARPVQLLHDGISRTVYAGIGGGTRAAAAATGPAVAARAGAGPAYRPPAERPRGNVAIGALNRAWGDLLARTSSALALSM